MNTMEYKVTVTILKEKNWFVAICEEYNLSAKSITIEDSLAALQQKLYEYLEIENPSIEVTFVYKVKMPI